MFRPLTKCASQLGFVFLLISFNQAFSQQASPASLETGEDGHRSLSVAKSEAKEAADASSILASFVVAEKKVRDALNQHTFKRDVVLQTIGPNGEVTGEYVRNSQFLFDDQGRRIEKVLFHPASTIREMRITREDIQDLAGGQLLGIDIAEATKYHLSYAGTEIIDSVHVFAIDVTPTTEPNPQRMKERYFIGRVWVDCDTFQIIKIKGIVEPQGKQRFPIFETWRQPIKNALAFPTRTEADDVLHFRERDVHYRIKVRYYDYQLFASRVTINEMDELLSDTSETPLKAKETSPKRNEALPKIKQAPTINDMRKKNEVCTTNRNAPPTGAYHWPADTEVKVYFGRNMFTPEQRAALLKAVKTWTGVEQEAGSGVRFIYAGLTDSPVSCQGCLTVKRREVQADDKRYYALFNPMRRDDDRLLFSAWIDFDFRIVDSKALEGFMAHELGHGLGLWDCPRCKKKQSIMNSFPGINQHNGLIAPSGCDVATMKTVYQEARQIAAAKSVGEMRPVAVRAGSALALPRPQAVPVFLERQIPGGTRRPK